MIVDKIQNSELYQNIHPRFARAFEYINKTDFSMLKDGKYEIEGEDIFAIVQEYRTKDKEESKLEGHRKYIDIQYISSGAELIGFAPLSKQLIISNDPQKDLVFYEGESSLFKIEAGMFAIFFPYDLHMPGIELLEKNKVKKVVVKVRL